ncbi:MAG TPA: cupin domain-containing protein [Actinomycetales bacterium]|nr:cupin domain-containing protein [Actinomycetales bacterium]
MTAVEQRDTLDTSPALRRLVAVDPDDFARRVWGRAALLSRREELAAEQSARDLLDADAVDELVSRRGLRTPFVRVAKNGTTLPEREFTASGGIGASIGDQVSDDKLLRLFADGATIVLQGLHRLWPPLIDFSQALTADLGHPVQVNAYVTPPQSRGFDDHYDVHDVFVLQVEGEKRWRVHEPVHRAPLRDQPWTDHRATVEAAAGTEPVIDTVLRPGDCLYLPRGYLHAATALGGVSTHLTFGVHTWTRHHLADELVRAALIALREDADTRASLPLGIDVGDAADVADEVELVRRRVAEAIGTVSADVVADRLAVRSRASSRAAPVGPLRQLRTAQEVGQQGVPLRLRPHLDASVERAGDASGRRLLRSRAGELGLAESDVPAVERLLVAARASGDDTAEGHPDAVSEEPLAGTDLPRATVADVLSDLAPDLVRRLVLAGVLVAE